MGFVTENDEIATHSLSLSPDSSTSDKLKYKRLRYLDYARSKSGQAPPPAADGGFDKLTTSLAKTIRVAHTTRGHTSPPPRFQLSRFAELIRDRSLEW